MNTNQHSEQEEWTGDYVANRFNINAWDTCDKIADAFNLERDKHNAALAAERENKDGYSSGYATAKAEYSAQLTAEHKRASEWQIKAMEATRLLLSERQRAEQAEEKVPFPCSVSTTVDIAEKVREECLRNVRAGKGD